MNTFVSRSIYVDLRCLQQLSFRHRGVGRHIRTLVDAIPIESRKGLKLHGVYDRALPELSTKDVERFDSLVHRADFKPGDIALNPIPLNNGDIWRIANGSQVLRVGIVHDFIAHEFPGLVTRQEDADAIARNVLLLRDYDFLLPNSINTLDMTRKFVSPTIPTFVTGVIVNDIFFKKGLQECKLGKYDRFFLVAAGNNRRKNAEGAIRAFGRLSASEPNIRMLLCGGYDIDGIQSIKRAVGLRAGVDWSRVQFLPWLSDEELAGLYRQSAAVIVPSFIEGFSIPVVEAIAAGGLVIASNCAVHRELIAEPLFDPPSDKQLAEYMHLALHDADWQDAALRSQKAAADRFRGENVGRDTWKAILNAVPKGVSAPTIRLNGAPSSSKPNILFVSPYLPEKTAVANFHAASMDSLLQIADVTVLAPNAPRQRMNNTQPCVIHEAEAKYADYDRIFYVVGNSPFHKFAVEKLQKNGGEVILHDSRLFEYYLDDIGADATLVRLSNEIGRPVERKELDIWAGDRRRLPTPLLGDIVNNATRFFVFSPVLAETLEHRYGVQATYIPVPVHNNINLNELGGDRARYARRHLGFKDNKLNLCMFGGVDGSKGMFETVYSLGEMLQDGLHPHLHFIGSIPDYIHSQLEWARSQVFGDLEITLHGEVEQETYIDFLLAADIGLQFRKAAFGQMSGALTDIASVGLWSIANVSLVRANASPPFVHTVSDRLEPLNIAYAVAALKNTVDLRERNLEQVQAFREPRTFSNFARILLDKSVIQR